MNIFPTVVREQARIHFAQTLQTNSTLLLFNIKGEKDSEISVTNGTSDISFNRNGLVSGVYLLQFSNASGIATTRFVLE